MKSIIYNLFLTLGLLIGISKVLCYGQSAIIQPLNEKMILEAYIIDTTENMVRYKLLNESNINEYQLHKSKIEYIQYQNGKVVNFPEYYNQPKPEERPTEIVQPLEKPKVEEPGVEENKTDRVKTLKLGIGVFTNTFTRTTDSLSHHYGVFPVLSVSGITLYKFKNIGWEASFSFGFSWDGIPKTTNNDTVRNSSMMLFEFNIPTIVYGSFPLVGNTQRLSIGGNPLGFSTMIEKYDTQGKNEASYKTQVHFTALIKYEWKLNPYSVFYMEANYLHPFLLIYEIFGNKSNSFSKPAELQRFILTLGFGFI